MKDFLKFVTYAGLFLVLLIPLFVSESLFFPYITGKNFAFRIIVEIIFASWVLLALLDTRYRPKFSWLLASGVSLLVVMLASNMLGEHPFKSFWSNFERMDGYVMLVHFVLFFVVLANAFQGRKIWNYYLGTSVAVATYIAFYGMRQSLGLVDGAAGRIDGTLGNAAYMAVYMLFHIFFVLWLWFKSDNNWWRSLYAVLFVLFVYVLLETGTRGTFLGLVGGLGVCVTYLAIFSRGSGTLRRSAIFGLVALACLALGFLSVRDTDYIQSNDSLARIANIDLGADLEVRKTIWGMASAGVAERPVFGWGQGNFNYVFNKEYDPSLHSQEQWFDRVHNIFFDWLIAGGVLGFVAYFSIWVGCVYYLFIRPMQRSESKEELFSVPEQAILLGVLAGYFIHNIVVFDNLVSYMFFAVVLAIIHSRVATQPVLDGQEVEEKHVVGLGLPVALALLVLLFFSVHLPGIQAGKDMIRGLSTNVVSEKFAAFESALARDSFAGQEVTEQYVQQALGLARDPNIDLETKNKYLAEAEEALKKLIAEKPNDARVRVFSANFYRNIGQYELAKEQIDIARTLSTSKQTIILEQGLIAELGGKTQEAEEYFKEAFLLDQDFKEARFIYGAALLSNGKIEEFEAIITSEYIEDFAENDSAVAAAIAAEDLELVEELLRTRVATTPQEPQDWANLGAFLHENGETAEALTVLESATEVLSSEYQPTLNCYIENLEAGNEPLLNC